VSEILFLCHRIPYPPNKGDKIRSWHWLKGLASRHAVHLGTFADDPADLVHLPVLEGLAASVRCEPLPWLRSRAAAACGVAVGASLSESVYRNARLGAWVRGLLAKRPISAIVVFSSSMAQYARNIDGQRVRRVLDMCDVDSDKWRQFAETSSPPMSWVYAYEQKRLAEVERACCEEFDSVVVSSTNERTLLASVAGSERGLAVLGNGVDLDYFDSSVCSQSPYDGESSPIAFTGAMDYWANVEAVTWFAREVLPLVRLRHPGATFVIVGSNPTPAVRALESLEGVRVTGTVADVRPYLQHARVVAAPLRVARGIQNKVLEALAMSAPVVATPQALVGLAEHAEIPGLSVAADAGAFAAALLSRLGGEGRQQNPGGREFVRKHFGWDEKISGLLRLVDGGIHEVATVAGSQ
jgi:polysaccharide biosynthesis protein PslH